MFCQPLICMSETSQAPCNPQYIMGRGDSERRGHKGLSAWTSASNQWTRSSPSKARGAPTDDGP